jgi:serine protease Do
LRNARTNSSTGRRVVSVVAIGAATALLSACFPLPGANGPAAVDFKHVEDATVRIYAEGTFIEPGTLDPYEGGWFGSGFIVDPSGLIVTNYHVAGGAESMVVWIGNENDDGQEIDAEIVGYSECLDLAVIQLKGEGPYPWIAWHKGEIDEALDVYSAGFPGGDPNFTLTRGIVSKADFEREFSWSSLDHVIEHDARIRGGNSGGPLVDAQGRVVGVNYAGDGGADDYNWAIHRDEVLDVLEDLEGGNAVQSLGMSASALFPEEGNAGVWVQSTQPGGPAEAAGVLPGDVITSLDGTALAQEGTLKEYCDIVGAEGGDAQLAVEVYRPSEDAFYEGTLNDTELAFVSGGTGQDDTIEGFTTVKDDEGVISISVPDEWNQLDGASFTSEAGNFYYSLIASPDLEGYRTTWGTPGVRLDVSEELADADVEAELAAYFSSVGDECTLDDEGDFDDGLYAGLYQYFTDCGGIDTDFVALVAKDYDGTHIVYLGVQMVDSSDKGPVLDEILATFIAEL